MKLAGSDQAIRVFIGDVEVMVQSMTVSYDGLGGIEMDIRAFTTSAVLDSARQLKNPPVEDVIKGLQGIKDDLA